MPAGKELWEQALGHAAAAAIEGIHGSGCLEPLVQSNAVKLLQTIQDILDNENLSDFDCVEEIVSRLTEAGISTSRHDFG